VLDSEALSRLAHGRQSDQAELVAALQSITTGIEAVLLTSAAVLAEVMDGDAGVWSAMRRLRVARLPVDDRIAVRAGLLLTAAGMDSSNAVDAFLAATAATNAPSTVVTGDPADLQALTADLPDVDVYPI
jgi:hypothetical protein